MTEKGSNDDGESFYEVALAVEALESAGEGGEPGEDLRVLRRRLREVLARRPDDVKLLLQGTDVLSRAAALEHRMSPKGREELAANVKAALDRLGAQLL